ncbi:hypothetical protein NLU13_4383 [Sarocladium strictum]|uniref:Uncharacterized protein n=1 Tax=Sarocladium strictum TaxID=5046 RepID=A0AA39GK54_SARSR|nr:hypothetical protein NLU13_4383 [Sarocladium strictum]
MRHMVPVATRPLVGQVTQVNADQTVSMSGDVRMTFAVQQNPDLARVVHRGCVSVDQVDDCHSRCYAARRRELRRNWSVFRVCALHHNSFGVMLVRKVGVLKAP